MNSEIIFVLTASKLDYKSFILLSRTCKTLRQLALEYNRDELSWLRNQLVASSSMYSDLFSSRNISPILSAALDRKKHKFTQQVLASPRCVELLLSEFSDEYSVDPSYNNNDPIIAACEYGYYDSLKMLLLDPRTNIAACDNQAFISACRAGHIDIVKLLLTVSEVDPADRDQQAFRCACLARHLDIVELLLEDSRIDPTANDNSAIRDARNNYHTEIVEVLLTDSRVREVSAKKPRVEYTVRTIATYRLLTLTPTVHVGEMDVDEQCVRGLYGSSGPKA
ncbi:Hypothetical protein POVR2_LOCUS146 [uncultured virus]|nr:Hypothetical protein POVR2_LOCUS146 [uncultured virus]